jgi:hypothetical protein
MAILSLGYFLRVFIDFYCGCLVLPITFFRLVLPVTSFRLVLPLTFFRRVLPLTSVRLVLPLTSFGLVFYRRLKHNSSTCQRGL